MNELNNNELKCSRCQEYKPKDKFYIDNSRSRGYTWYCKICSSNHCRKGYLKFKEKRLEKIKEYNRKNQEVLVKKRNPVKEEARIAVRTEVAKGKFVKTACIICEDSDSEFHHTNGYDKPNWFVGMWLCRSCHVKEHNKLRELNYV